MLNSYIKLIKLLIKAKIDKLKVRNKDINNIGKIINRIATSESLVINIWNFLSKLKLSSC